MLLELLFVLFHVFVEEELFAEADQVFLTIVK